MQIPDAWLEWRLRRRGTSSTSPAAPVAHELYSRLINERISPAMRELGMVGSGGRYSFTSDTHWALVGFQKSAYSDRHEIRFTVNLLVVSKSAWDAEKLRFPHYPERPNASTVWGGDVAGARLGSLVEAGVDKWWRVNDVVELDVVARDVIGDLTDAGIPWVRRQMAR